MAMPEPLDPCLCNICAGYPESYKAIQEYQNAEREKLDRWVPACGGLETPFKKNGRTWLYVFNPGQGCHGYLDMGQDVVFDSLSD
jgi:hypothetical protein